MLLFKDKRRNEIVNSEDLEEEKLTFAGAMKILANALKNSPALTLTISGGVFYHIVLGAAGIA